MLLESFRAACLALFELAPLVLRVDSKRALPRSRICVTVCMVFIVFAYFFSLLGRVFSCIWNLTVRRPFESQREPELEERIEKLMCFLCMR